MSSAIYFDLDQSLFQTKDQLFSKQALVFTYPQYMYLENTMAKGEIARKKQFLVFPTVFSTHLENFLSFSSGLKLQTLSVWKNLKFDVLERVKVLVLW